MTSMETLIEKTHAFVEEYMSKYDASHDFQHITRVLNMSKYIAAEEMKDNPTGHQYDMVLVELGALLHDVRVDFSLGLP
jgi:uncharacterized protein